MSKASDIIDALYTVEPDKRSTRITGVTHLSLEERLPVSCKGKLEFWVSTVHNNVNRIQRVIQRGRHTLLVGVRSSHILRTPIGTEQHS
jgi:hypothetical protein